MSEQQKPEGNNNGEAKQGEAKEEKKEEKKEEEKKEEKKEEAAAPAKPAKKTKKSKKKLEAERKAEEERQRLLKEEEDRKRAEEEERLRIEEEKRAKEEAERKAEEERIRLEAEARERELAEKIVVVPDDEDENVEELNKERPEDKLYDYNGKKIKPNLLKSDITDDIKEKAFEMGFLALSKYTAEKEMSEFIKNEFDKLFEPEWQIVIGKDFSVAFSFEIENFVFFQIEDIYFLFYKL